MERETGVELATTAGQWAGNGAGKGPADPRGQPRLARGDLPVKVPRIGSTEALLGAYSWVMTMSRGRTFRATLTTTVRVFFVSTQITLSEFFMLLVS